MEHACRKHCFNALLTRNEFSRCFRASFWRRFHATPTICESWVQPNTLFHGKSYFHRDWKTAESWYMLDVEGKTGPPRQFSSVAAIDESMDDEERAASSVTAEFAAFKHAAAQQAGDEPVDMKNPYERPKKQCLLCKHDITMDFKNPRLLSQFTSQFSGMPYPKHITNLCDWQDRKLKQELTKAQKACFMPTMQKLPHYVYDPLLYDPFNPKRGF